MPSLLNRARELLRDTRNYVQGQDRYRLCPLYSVLLALIASTFWSWPHSKGLTQTYAAHFWLFLMKYILFDIAMGLALILGVIGLFRRGWIPAVLSCIGVYYAFDFLVSPDWKVLWLTYSYYIIDVPATWIARTAGSDQHMRTALFAVYLLALYIIIRPFAKRAWVLVTRLEDALVLRHPALAKWQRPVL